MNTKKTTQSAKEFIKKINEGYNIIYVGERLKIAFKHLRYPTFYTMELYEEGVKYATFGSPYLADCIADAKNVLTKNGILC